MSKKKSHKTYGASEFKARCLELLDLVGEKGEEYIITKRGKPVAKIVPLKPIKSQPIKGMHKGLIDIKQDIVNVTFEDDWDVLK